MLQLQSLLLCSKQADSLQSSTAPCSWSVGGSRVDRDADKRRIEPLSGVLVRQLGHGGDPRHPGHKLGAGRHIVGGLSTGSSAAAKGHNPTSCCQLSEGKHIYCCQIGKLTYAKSRVAELTCCADAFTASI